MYSQFLFLLLVSEYQDVNYNHNPFTEFGSVGDYFGDDDLDLSCRMLIMFLINEVKRSCTKKDFDSFVCDILGMFYNDIITEGRRYLHNKHMEYIIYRAFKYLHKKFNVKCESSYWSHPVRYTLNQAEGAIIEYLRLMYKDFQGDSDFIKNMNAVLDFLPVARRCWDIEVKFDDSEYTRMIQADTFEVVKECLV